MLKKDARPMVQRQMRTGHYQISSTHFYQFCPMCRERVDIEFWVGDNGKQMLRDALVTHVSDKH